MTDLHRRAQFTLEAVGAAAKLRGSGLLAHIKGASVVGLTCAFWFRFSSASEGTAQLLQLSVGEQKHKQTAGFPRVSIQRGRVAASVLGTTLGPAGPALPPERMILCIITLRGLEGSLEALRREHAKVPARALRQLVPAVAIARRRVRARETRALVLQRAHERVELRGGARRRVTLRGRAGAGWSPVS